MITSRLKRSLKARKNSKGSIEKTSKKEEFDINPIIQAIENNDDAAVVQFITEHEDLISVEDPETGNSLLHHACRCGLLPIVKLLLHNNANVRCVNKEGWTALHYAVVNGHPDVVEQLMFFHVGLHSFTSDGLNAVHLAAFTGHHDILEYLFTFCVDVHQTTTSGWTALHLAASNNHVRACRVLLDHGANINAYKSPQGTALHLAAKEDHVDVVIELVKHNADVNITDENNRKPKHLCKEDSRTYQILETAELTRIRLNEPELDVKQEDQQVLTAEEEEQQLQNLEARLFHDIDEYVEEARKTSSDAPHSPDTENLSEEAKFTRMVRQKSVYKQLQTNVHPGPSIEAWNQSGLQETDETVDEKTREKQRAESVAITFGAPADPLTDQNIAFAYPGADKVVQSTNMLWSWLSRVAGVVIDKQAQESMEQILRLLNTLFHDRNQKRSVNAMLSLTTLILYHNATHLRSEVLVKDDLVIDNCVHYFKFACAAYGWKMLNPLMFSSKRTAVLFKGFVTGDRINDQALCEHTGIAPEDIITVKWTSSDYHPAHYLAYDHSTRSIIIAIRGSFHVKDALVDLIACATPFQGGYAHLGMLECAKRKLDVIREPLMNAIEKYPQYTITVIGHSLGAGTASLLTFLLKELLPKADIKCHAFAPPCVVSPELALNCSQYITSYVLGNDCVPRLSYASVLFLKEFTMKLMDEAPSGVQVLLKTKRGAINIEEIKQSVEFSIDSTLLPPGKCIHIVKETPDRSNQDWISPNDMKKCFRMEYSCPTLFSEVIVCSTMFSDHVPWKYHAAIEGVAHRQQLHRHNLLNPPPLVIEKPDVF